MKLFEDPNDPDCEAVVLQRRAEDIFAASQLPENKINGPLLVSAALLAIAAAAYRIADNLQESNSGQGITSMLADVLYPLDCDGGLSQLVVDFIKSRSST